MSRHRNEARVETLPTQFLENQTAWEILTSEKYFKWLLLIPLMAVLGVFARLMPDMNVLFISMPLRVGMGLLMMVIFLPFINQFIGEFAKWMGELLPL